MRPPVPAADCTSMVEVRAGVDALDQALVALIAERFGFMDAAARIKRDRAAVRDEARKAAVIANVRRHAKQQGLCPDLMERLWEELVEASIAHEFQAWDAHRAGVC